MAQWLNRCRSIRQVSGSIQRGFICNFGIGRNVFDWLDPGSIPARVRRKKFRLPASRNPGSNPRHDRVRSLMSLACRLRSERPGFDSGFGSTAFRGIGRCRLRATETQQATPRNYADGRDRRRREAAATAPRAWSRKCPGEPTLKCGDKGCFYTRRAQWGHGP